MKLLCPCCGEEITFGLAITEVRKFETVEQGPDWWKSSLSPEQINVVERAQINGLLDALKTAMSKAVNTQAAPPRSVERFFLTLLKTMRPKRIPKFCLDALYAEFGGRIDFWSAQGIGIVLSDGAIVMFVPLDVVVGTAISPTGSSGRTIRMDTKESEFYAWIKTRMGYVPTGKGLFLEEMRRKSFGEFARPTL
jgi:hypothetical protein